MDRELKIDRFVNKTEIDGHINTVQSYDIDIRLNHIYLFGIESYASGSGVEGTDEPGVEYILANRFIRNLNLCMRANKDTPIIIHMKTCGGSWEEGMAIYDAISSCPNPVTILNYTHARSMSSLIFQAASKRVMMPHSYFMFHDGTFGVEGTVKTVESAVEFNKRITSGQMLDVYTKMMREGGSMSHMTKNAIKKWLRAQMDKKEDVYLTPKETVTLGLADEIFNGNWSELINYTEKQLQR